MFSKAVIEEKDSCQLPLQSTWRERKYVLGFHKQYIADYGALYTFTFDVDLDAIAQLP